MTLSKQHRTLLINSLQRIKLKSSHEAIGLILNWAEIEQFTKTYALLLMDLYNKKTSEHFIIRNKLQEISNVSSAVNDSKVYLFLVILTGEEQPHIKKDLKTLYKLRNNYAHTNTYDDYKNVIRKYDCIFTFIINMLKI